MSLLLHREPLKTFLIVNLIRTARLLTRRLLLLMWAEGVVYFLVSGINPTLHWFAHFLELLALRSLTAPQWVWLRGSRLTGGRMWVRLTSLRGNDNGRSLTKRRCECFSLGGVGLLHCVSVLLLLTGCWENAQRVRRATLRLAAILCIIVPTHLTHWKI